ncbi:MAG: UbiA family prenyltransferase [Candidatus Acidiferrales bacterium]
MASPVTATDLRASVPICVDLDGTLVCTDTMWECLIAAWRKNFWLLFLFPVWLLRGRAYLKHEAAKHANLDTRSLPYDVDLLNWLAEQRDGGRTVMLVTGSSSAVAHKVAKQLGIFSEVISSTMTSNLSGQNKLKALRDRFQGREFEYIGDSRADVPIWAYLGRAHVRGASRRLCAQLERQGIQVVSQGRHRGASLKAVARQLRIHQWSKNLLIFIPLFTSHKFTHTTLLLRSFLAFAAFSFVASAFYIFNDLLDVRADRLHPNKRERPIASGQLSMNHAAVLLLITLTIGLVLAASVSKAFLGVTLAYLVGTATYSLYAKRLVLVDAFVLGLLYTVRVIGGGVATGIPISSWTLGYTSFLFLSLALMKRYSEMSQRAPDAKGATLPGRAYELQDLSIIGNIGISSGLMSALLMALYLRSPEVEVLYRRPAFLLPLCIIHVYWISRAWLLTNRHLMHDDPIVFALKDGVTHKLFLLAAIIAYFAT